MARQRRNAVPPWWVLIFLLTIGLSAMEGIPREIVIFIVGVLAFWAIFLWVIFQIQKSSKKKASSDHSHSQTKQKQDYKINSATGQVVNRQTVRKQHSSYEHWKEQLDSLLENGTILKEEYDMLLRQHK